ncbi:hypothetical protein SAMN05216480_1038 [Pustulibacterium marinum]|uniref:ATPase family associated with various cellular activities (AAA) n=1 Tax=Pustulibacterium marinum TaxID=1224947 RepID=A0A1I7G0B9_9FLAO|nr:AVAST type 4 anti-phage nuclease Avs4 [Pustulibacterium marinum]SFU41756.1 hypothetical protein SAMN05216480_1038 [Pustulibacterium marinum]
MIKLNWNIFRAKFDGEETSMFELLAYHLFCDEYNVPTGIFRFKNQTGIETEPIEKDNQLIGFQAKYYDSKVSDNKEDIIDSIKKAKSKNKDLDKILFYLNKEFSESSSKDKKDPKYKVEIEKEAENINIEIIWKVQSNFEIQLAKPHISYLGEYFFSNEKSKVDSLNEIDLHTKSILTPIHCDIQYKENQIKIDRNDIILEIESQTNTFKSIIISGNGGTGKTALVKELYDRNKSKPFYVFKANEFLIKHINDLFFPYSISFSDFLKCHENEKSKVIIIDSAERLSEIENNEPFKEFVASLIENNWCIIFTTRNIYLDDLRFQLIHVYRLSPNNISLENITEDELNKFAQSYGFIIPPEIRLQHLIRNPFYLNQYLTFYSEDSQKASYSDFKTNLWKTKIQNSTYTKNNIHIEREECFLSLAKDRSKSGNFYSKAEGYSKEPLSLLQNEEIIEYSSSNNGYFITHDIYEEWALDLLIERTFQEHKRDLDSFFAELGTSLSIRRAFRLWISNKIFLNPDEIEEIIEEVIYSETIDTSWQDEILISILLSDISNNFFCERKDLLFKEEFKLLRRIIFLLRTACKEVNEPLMKMLKVNDEDISPEYIFTIPKGSGWGAIINVISNEFESFSIEDASFLIPLLKEWNDEFKTGTITRESSKIALKFYECIISQKETYRYSDILKGLVKIIIQGARELVAELQEIFKNVIDNKWTNHNSPYNKLCKYVLTKTHENIPIIQALPSEIIKIADLFWFKQESEDNDMFGYGGIDMEQYYSLNKNGFDYFPSSALQTPIYWLLRFSPKETFDFIVDFTNRTVEYYSKSKYGEDVECVDIHIDDGITQKQYISNALWSMHRGTGSPVTPHVLQCMHMALEKYLLETAKIDKTNILSQWLKYLLAKSKSASITSVVASVVKAHPEKYFEIAEILFKSIELFLYDITLYTSEHTAATIYRIGAGMNQRNKVHEDERIKTLKDKHRKVTIEHIALNYQFFKSEETKDEEVERRQNSIWSIIDEHKKKKLTKTQKLLIARIDRRKMKPKIEQKDNGILVDLNPEIEPELKRYSEEGEKEYSSFMKYTALSLWSRNKFDQKQDTSQYAQYENNPNLVIKEINELINPDIAKSNHFDFSTPAFASFALLKEYSESLSEEELELCRDIIHDFAIAPLRDGYGYQISDGVEVAINAIPLLYRLFPDNKKDYNNLLLLILFDEHSIGEYKRVCDYSIESIVNSLWEISSEDALIIIYAFLKIKPLYSNFKNVADGESKHPFSPRKPQAVLVREFIESNEDEIEDVFQVDVSDINFDDLNLNDFELKDLETVIQLVPIKSQNKLLNSFILKILPILFENLLKYKRETNLIKLRFRFFRKICPFILNKDSQEISSFISPIVNHLSSSEETKYLLEEFISTQDRINRYEQFWLVWEAFYSHIVRIAKEGGYHTKELVHSYLLAWPWWRKDAKEWHSLKSRDKRFYKRIVADLGENVFVLDSVSQVLNQIGSNFINDGIFWISDMLNSNKNLWTDKLGVNTVYYLEILIRKYLFINRTEVRRNKNLKERVLVILNFLIEKSSVNAYLLREEIL